MNQQAVKTRQQFNEAINVFGLDGPASDRLWAFAQLVGMPIDDFTLSILLYGAKQEKTALDAEQRMRDIITEFDRDLNSRLDGVVDAATKEIAANNSQLTADLRDKISEAVTRAVDTAIVKVGDSFVDESRARVSRANMVAASICVCGIMAVGGLAYATGYATGRDNAVITATRFEQLAKDPGTASILKVIEFNDPSTIPTYCGRGSSSLREIEGRPQCLPPLWVGGDAYAVSNHMSGAWKRTAATIENWAATSSWWLLLLVGAGGAMVIRKGVRNFVKLTPVRWLFDID